MNMFSGNMTIRDLKPADVIGTPWDERVVTGLTVNSRAVQPGYCFVAYPGHAADGRSFIADALARGAAVVLAEAEGLESDSAQPVIPVPRLKQRLGEIASRFYGNPSAQLHVLAVTGTNGKTTITQLIAQAAQLAGHKAGVIGTLGNGPLGHLQPSANTTPDVIAINACLRGMADAGVAVVAMEASSHGLAQGRLDGLTLHAGIISNLSRDHLDYHGSMEAYRDAKALLVQHGTLQHLVLNADDPSVVAMAELASDTVNIIRFSARPEADVPVKALAIRYGVHGLSMDVMAYGKTATIDSALVGEFNGANLLAALAGLLTLEIDLATACHALSQCQPVRGRMQMVNPGNQADAPAVVVDYAHTPDALEKALSALRHHCTGQLWCVFGCGGNRDVGKRPLMAAVVAAQADHRVVTSDNPRNEKPGAIIADILKGFPAAVAFEVIEDRAAAIEYAVLNAAAGDVILIAGKGHEDYQEVQGVKHFFSDVEAAQAALAKRTTRQG